MCTCECNNPTANTLTLHADAVADGWSKLVGVGSSVSDVTTAVFYKEVAVAGDTGKAVVIETAAAGEMVGWFGRITGAGIIAPEANSTNLTSGTSHTLPNVSSVSVDTLGFYVLGFDGGDGTPFGAPGGSWTEIDEHNSGTTGNDSCGVFGTQAKGAIGALGAPVISSSTGDNAANIVFVIAGPDISRSGSIDQTLPILTQAVTGTFTPPTSTGSIAQTLPGLVQAATGTHVFGSYATFYFDASDEGPTGTNWSGSGGNGFNGNYNDGTQILDPNVNELSGGGTTAPAGASINILSVQFRSRVYISAYDDLDIEIFTDGKAESLGSQNSGTTPSPKWLPWQSLSVPTGGWTWAKLAALEAYINPTWTAGDGISRLYIIELKVNTDADTATTTYHIDGSDVAVASANWTNISNAVDGNDTTYAQIDDPDTGNITADGTNAPSTGDIIVNVHARMKAYNNSYGVLNYWLELTSPTDTILGTQTLGVVDPAAYSDWALCKVPYGGWTWPNVQRIEWGASVGTTDTGAQGRVYITEIRVEYVSSDARSGSIDQTMPIVTQAVTGTFAPGTSTGSIAQILPGLVQALTGTFLKTYTASIAQTMPSLVSSATGTFHTNHIGSIAQTMPVVIQVSTGTFVPWSATGTIAQLLPAVMQSATGSHSPPVFSGTIDQTLPILIQALTGTHAVVFSGSIAQTLPSLTQALTGTFLKTYSGTIDQTLPIVTQTLTGTFVPPVFSATIDQTLPIVTQALTGTFTVATFSASINQTLPSLISVATGTFAPGTSTGTIDQTLSGLIQAATGTFLKTYTASIDQTLPIVIQALTGDFIPPGAVIGSIDQTLPILTQSLTGTFVPWSATGSIDQTLPILISTATGTFVPWSATGSIDQTLPILTQSLTGTFVPGTSTGSIDQTLPNLIQTLIGTFAPGTKTGSIDQTLPFLVQDLTGFTGTPTFTGSIDQTLPSLVQTLTGTFLKTYIVTIDQTLPSLVQTLTGTHVAPVFTGSISQIMPMLLSVAWFTPSQLYVEHFIWVVPNEDFLWMVEEDVLIYPVPTDDLIYIISTGD
jgi:hypothetical protein